jgi:hypothetical protein
LGVLGNPAKWREWISRYGWAEVSGTIGSYLGFLIVNALTHSLVAASFGAALGENIGFYGAIFAREHAERRRAGDTPSARQYLAIAKTLIHEFGAAELLDFVIVRPATTFFAVTLFGKGAGVMIGKISADLVFYSLAISFYERRRAKRDAL